MHGENRANRITNYGFGNTANEQSRQARSVMLGKDYYSSAHLLLGFDDLFHRMTGAEYRLHVQIREFLLDDLAEALDRLFN